MIFQNNEITHSPVEQEFIWVAEYPNGTHLSEFDFETKQENEFNDIDRDQVFRFGLLGLGHKIFFERDGIINFSGNRLQFFYEIDGKMLPLNGDFKYDTKDIIHYKDAEAVGSLFSGQTEGVLTSNIVQYSVGYKANIDVGGVNFNFKPIVMLPKNKPAVVSLWLVADQKLDGTLIITNNGRVVFDTKAPLEPNKGGELNWVIE